MISTSSLLLKHRHPVQLHLFWSHSPLLVRFILPLLYPQDCFRLKVTTSDSFIIIKISWVPWRLQAFLTSWFLGDLHGGKHILHTYAHTHTQSHGVPLIKPWNSSVTHERPWERPQDCMPSCRWSIRRAQRETSSQKPPPSLEGQESALWAPGYPSRWLWSQRPGCESSY